MSEEVEEQASLLESNEAPQENEVDNANEEASVEHDDSVKPEFVKDQFWDKENGKVNLEALAKSQADFERQARTKQPDAPKEASEYEVKVPEGMEIDTENDPLITASRDIALKHGLSKEAYEGFMGDMMSVLAENQNTPDLEAEKAKLGDNADSVIDHVVGWADKLQKIGLLSEDERTALNGMGTSAAGISALNKLRVHYTRSADIPTQISTDDGSMSATEFYAAVGSDRYASDPDYRAKVSEQGKRIFGTDSAGSSPRGLGV